MVNCGNRRIQLRICTAIAWVTVVLMPQHAYSDARTHFRRGESAYQQANYELAIQEWQKAYKLDRKPRIQHNLALAYERLGRLGKAIRALEIFLKSADPDDPAYGDATARLNSLKQRLAATGIKISGGVQGALILVDGHNWGLMPRPDRISIEPGAHDVVIRHKNYQDFISNVVVPAGQIVEVKVRMVSKTDSENSTPSFFSDSSEPTQLSNSLPPATTPTPSDPVSVSASSDTVDIENQPSEPDQHSSDRIEDNPLFWYLLSGGLAIGAVGAAAWTAERNSELNGCNDSDRYYCRNETQVRREQGTAFLMTALFTVGAIGTLIYGIIISSSNDSAEEKPSHTQTTDRCSVGLLGTRCRIQF